MKILYKEGNDRIYEHGEYELIETDKTITLKLIKQAYFYSAHLPKGDLKFSKSKGYTVEKLKEGFYPMRAGTPHWLE